MLVALARPGVQARIPGYGYDPCALIKELRPIVLLAVGIGQGGWARGRGANPGPAPGRASTVKSMQLDFAVLCIVTSKICTCNCTDWPYVPGRPDT